MNELLDAFFGRHLPVLPVVLPLFTAALLLLAGDGGGQAGHGGAQLARARRISLASALVGALLAWRLFTEAASGTLTVYPLGDWPAPFGIVLVVDRLSALLLALTWTIAVPVLWYASGGWDAHGRYFHAVFHFQLMGLSGAFVTGDLFNLFVFFEVLLIASYGLLLSGGRGERLRAGLHYVSFNIAASSLFLVALGLLYGLLGTLNMAELGQRIAALPAQDAALVAAAGGLLLVVFCAKAALLPLYFWLPQTYTHAPAAVAGLFAIMTKVGLYALLRVASLLFAAGPLAGFAWPALLALGAATLLLAALGVLAAVRLRTLAAYLMLGSAATLFVAFALHTEGTVSAGLFYLVHSTFAGAALFLLADLIRRRRGRAGDRKDVPAQLPDRSLPGVLFLLVAVALAGLPPLSGFVGKLLLLQAVPAGAPTLWIWLLVLGTGLLTLVGLARAGSRLFWRLPPLPAGVAPTIVAAPARPRETAAIVLLLGYGIAMVLAAAPLLDYLRASAAQLQAPEAYLAQVRAQLPQGKAP